MIQWLEFGSLTVAAPVQSLVWELRFHIKLLHASATHTHVCAHTHTQSYNAVPQKEIPGALFVAQRKGIGLVFIRRQIQPLTSLSGLKIRCCCELWCRSHLRLRSGVAMAVM